MTSNQIPPLVMPREASRAGLATDPPWPLERLLPVARGLEPADLVLKGARVVNVLTRGIEALDVAVAGGLVVGLGRYEGREEVDLTGRYLAPGLIDPHLHLESTMLAPSELARLTVPRGTTAMVCDPHEIANVLGLRGIEFLIEASAGIPLDIFFMAPSCVPATHLETSGACLNAEDLVPLLAQPRILGLAEVMNFPGVIFGLPAVLDKIRLFTGRPIDGHAPFLSGPDLCAYVLSGVATEHESSTLAGAREKLARGLRIFIRECGQARNMAALLPLATEANAHRLSFCTDDPHPEDLLRDGHLDHILRRAVALGLPPERALTMASLSPAEAHGLPRRGALAPGWLADMVVFKSLETFEVERVYKNGRLVARDGRMVVEPPQRAPLPNWASPMNLAPFPVETLSLPAAGPRVRVIGLVPGQILTEHLIVETPSVRKGNRPALLAADPDRDLARLIVVERHRATGNIGQGLVRGFGLTRGALATSVAHDSHNIVAVGLSSEELLLAVHAVAEMGGGLVAVAGERVLARLPLPLAGLISWDSASDVAAAVQRLNAAAQEMGAKPDHPFMILSFLALPVIPALKLTDLGLVDVEKFALTSLFVE